MNKLVFRVHAIQRMFDRGISRDDVRHVIEYGEVIREYPDDIPFPSRLVLGWCENRPIHVVASDDDDARTIIITAYEPDPTIWEPGYKNKRRKKNS